VVSESPTAIITDERTLVEPDGSRVMIARFRAGTIAVDLHVGSTDPPLGNVAVPPNGAGVVSSVERPRLVGAFNGGFKSSTGVGGIEVDGQVLRPLVGGQASVVIDANGTPSVGVWGQGVPRPGAAVVSVRQNLRPLVDGARLSPAIANVGSWGATVGGRSSVARSAVGEDGAGNLLYAGSSAALPVDLADALVGAGAVTAMELDINPAWVQLDLAPSPGGPLSSGIPGQIRPADQYLSGWTRDFFAILSRP
jgi:hypothetical protein